MAKRKRPGNVTLTLEMPVANQVGRAVHLCLAAKNIAHFLRNKTPPKNDGVLSNH